MDKIYFVLIFFLLFFEKSFCENFQISNLDVNFEEYLKTFNKSYSNAMEYKKRKKAFSNNLKEIEKLQVSERGTAIYGINKISDWTKQEQQNLFGLNLRVNFTGRTTNVKDLKLSESDSFDWRDKNVISSVKNQKTCQCSWAFATIGNIEALNAIKNPSKPVVNLSVQQLIDCDQYSSGCLGGNPIYAIKNTIYLGGVEVDTDYPYTGTEHVCQFNLSNSVVTVVDGIQINSSEDKMADWLTNNGPIITGINSQILLPYTNGVIDTNDCNPYYLNHAVLIVGFGLEHSLPFWIVKNSWGADWGESGYFRIRRGNGTCGINMIPMSAVLKNDDLKLTTLSILSFIFITGMLKLLN